MPVTKYISNKKSGVSVNRKSSGQNPDQKNDPEEIASHHLLSYENHADITGKCAVNYPALTDHGKSHQHHDSTRLFSYADCLDDF